MWFIMLKRCACGRSFRAESWGRLRLLGQMDNGRQKGELVELRQCAACGSSMAIAIGEHAPSTPRIKLESHADHE